MQPIRQTLVLGILVIGLIIALTTVSPAQNIIYTYDGLNRLIRVDYGNGNVIEYVYDQVGNRQYMGPVDTTPPVTTASPPGGVYNAPQTVTLTCNDGTGSGCYQTYYSTDNSYPSLLYSSRINISTDTTLKFYSTDFASNSESVNTQVYTIDTTPPTGTIIINSGAASTNNTSVALTLSCADANGCFQMQFSNDNITYSSPESYATSKAWLLTTGDGIKTVYVKFKDTPGNWSSPFSSTILLDTIPPTTTPSPPGGIVPPGQTVTLTCNDGIGSGCQKTCYTADGSPLICPTCPNLYSTPIPVSDTTLKCFSIDFAQNCEATRTEVYTLARVMIGSVPYATIQAAYNAAANGSTIKCRELTFTESLTVNRNITVTLDGGYDTGFTTNYGRMTSLKGTITTTVGGGTIMIRNFILTQ